MSLQVRTAADVTASLSPGMRMKELFDTAKAASGLPDDELEALFAEESYEARMAAFCILDFQARKRPGDPHSATPISVTTTASTPGTWSTGQPRGSSGRPWSAVPTTCCTSLLPPPTRCDDERR